MSGVFPNHNLSKISVYTVTGSTNRPSSALNAAQSVGQLCTARANASGILGIMAIVKCARKLSLSV